MRQPDAGKAARESRAIQGAVGAIVIGAEARQALQQAEKLNPARLWTKQQLEKTPAQ